MMNNNTKIFIDLLNKPFKLNGRGPEFFDCYGLYLEVNKRLGNIIPDIEELAIHTSKVINDNVDRYIGKWEKIKPEDKQVGDAILFKEPGQDFYNHIGVVISKYEFMQISEDKPVHIINFSHPWFKSSVKGFYRYDN